MTLYQDPASVERDRQRAKELGFADVEAYLAHERKVRSERIARLRAAVEEGLRSGAAEPVDDALWDRLRARAGGA